MREEMDGEKKKRKTKKSFPLFFQIFNFFLLKTVSGVHFDILPKFC